MAYSIKKAVIPCAGLGTRFLPVTRSVPKVLLPVVDRPLIHFAVEEAAQAGIDQIALVVSPGMDSVAGYFGSQPVLENALEAKGDEERLAQQREIAGMADVETIVQHEPKGLGHAVLMAKDFVGDEPFAVFLPDDLIWADPPAISQLIRIAEKHGGSVLAGKHVPQEAIPNLGIIDAEHTGGREWSVKGLVEKPPLEEAPTDLAIIGRYVLSPSVFRHIESGAPGALGEIQLTDAIAATMPAEPVHACAFEGDHIDAGTPRGMLQATLYEASRRPDLAPELDQFRKG
ncbi:MAG: UTP--glucose-1-phosphate uridylyltransferase [Chloroflexota bacterium]